MPSIIPSYVYTLFASAIVGILVVSACMVSVGNLKREAEEQQLSNLAGYVAVKVMQLANCMPQGNSTTSVSLELPSSIANQRYWIMITNGSSGAEVSIGLGKNVVASRQRVSLPLEVSASGLYISSSALAKLECRKDSSGLYLTIS
jgi:hypothetical protein